MLRIIEIESTERRNDCVAFMCAEVYGTSAGLTPLVHYARVVGELLPNHAARVVALAEGDSLKSVALLVLEEGGKALSLELLATPAQLRGNGYARELLERLAKTTPLRVSTLGPEREAFFTTFGFPRWWDDPAVPGKRIGMSATHPATSLADISPVCGVADSTILRTFKNDPATFEHYKHAFVAAIERAPGYFSQLH